MNYQSSVFQLQQVPVYPDISPNDFQSHFVKPGLPVILRSVAGKWNATSKWNYDFFQTNAGNITVPLYNNEKSKPWESVNAADVYMSFGEFLDLIKNGPTQLRIFLFNIFRHLPELCNDFNYPDELLKGFLKKFPMLFFGGEGSVVHLHYDMDLSDIFLTQFQGRKKVLLFHPSESNKLYRLPWMVQSFIDPANPDLNKYPALNFVKGYQCIMEHGDTLYMPGGYWHYMEYTESGFALALRAFPNGISKRTRSLYNLFIMRNFDNIMKKWLGEKWFIYKEHLAEKRAAKYLGQVEDPSGNHQIRYYP
jgi:hypothetical protein